MSISFFFYIEHICKYQYNVHVITYMYVVQVFGNTTQI